MGSRPDRVKRPFELAETGEPYFRAVHTGQRFVTAVGDAAKKTGDRWARRKHTNRRRSLPSRARNG